MTLGSLVIATWVLAAPRGPLPIQNDYGALVIVLLIALPIVALLVGLPMLSAKWLRERLQARTMALRQLANELGWDFAEEYQLDWEAISKREHQDVPMAGSHIREICQSLQFTNLMSGKLKGIGFKVFDFAHLIRAGKTTVWVRQTAVELQGPAKTPKFELRPERGWWERSLFESYQDFDFAAHPLFSKRYQLSGNNEAQVRAAFTPHVIAFFEQHEQLWVENLGPRFVYLHQRVLVEPEGIRDFVDEAFRCYRLFDHSEASSS